MGWSLRESTPGRKGAGSPPIPPPRFWCRAHGDMENHWRTMIVLKQAGSLLASCLSAFIHSLPSSLLHPFKITHCSHTGTTTCFWYPGKVTTCQEKNRRAKPLQADLLNAQRGFSSREISQGRGQSPHWYQRWSCDSYHRKLSCCWIPGHLSPVELMSTRSCLWFMFLKCSIKKCLWESSGRSLSRASVRSQVLAGGHGRRGGGRQCQVKVDTPLFKYITSLLMTR